MKKENPQISVIVPVYNVEKYLPRCIESILAQTFTDFELLLIDDGSKDSSGKICDKYAEEDERIKVFHKKNGGVGLARQYGTDNAVGKYSIHADADDWMEPDMLKRMFEKIKEKGVDMLIADFFIDLPNNKIKYRKQIANGCQSQDVMRDILQGNLFGALWHKMIRHELYRKYNVRFLKGVNYCEDVLVLVQLLQNPLRIGFIHEAFYHYNNQNNDSITRNYTLETYNMRKLYVERLEELLADNDSEIIDTVVLDIKIEAFSYGVLSEEEYYTYKPSSLSAIICKKHCGMKYKLCLILAYFRLYRLALLVLGIHNKHNNK